MTRYARATFADAQVPEYTAGPCKMASALESRASPNQL
jgi:hypothetical protein